MRHRALRLLLAAGLSTTCPWMIDCVGDDSTPSTSDGGAADNVSPTSDGATSDAAADGLTEAGTSVTGKVVDLSGSPVPNAKVRVGSAPIVTTDANGAFTIADVAASYDLDVATTDNQLRAYRGLHTRTPVVHTGGTNSQTQLAYDVQGVPADAGVASVTINFIADESAQGAGVISLSGTTTMNWLGSSQASGALAVLLFNGSGSGTTILAKPAIASAALSAGALHTQAFQYVSAQSASISGVLSGAAADTVWVGLHDPQLPPLGLQRYASATPSGSAFTVPTVSYPGVTYDLAIDFSHANPKEAVTGWLTGLPANASGLTAQYIYPAVHATTPAESATDVSASTAFSWTQTPGTYSLRVTCGLSYRLTMTLAANSTTLPDFTALGVPLPTASSCTWSVTSYPTHTDLDDFVGVPATRAKLLTSPSSSVNGVAFTTK